MKQCAQRCCAAATMASWVGAVVAPVWGAAPPPPTEEYVLVGSYTAPDGSWDVMSDGRLVAIAGENVVVQDGLNASTYSEVGSVGAGLTNGDPSFVRVSPDGATLAFGDNNFGAAASPSVHFLATATLDPATTSPVFSVPSANLDAHWTDEATLFVTGGDAFGAPSFVTRIDASDLGALTADVAITNIGGASGGITSDGTSLYTSNGFDNGPGGTGTGAIRAFSLDAATFGAVPLDFEADGSEIGEVLSGSPLDFDHLGNLLVGGGDFDEPDFGYAGVVAAGAVADALAGGSPIPASAVQQLAPGGAFDFYSIRANPATSEVLVTFFGDDRVYRYAIPSPGGVVVLLLGAIVRAGRRRDAI